MRCGIFGGTFDPVHLGHLLVAEYCREQARLDEVLFLPAACPPHKQGEPITPPHHRVQMLELAIAGHAPFRVCTLEIDRGGISYTVETLTRLHAERPQAEFFLLMGADTLADLPNWREPARILELALPLVAARPGAAEVDFSVLDRLLAPDRRGTLAGLVAAVPRIELASREIRRRVAAGLSIRFQTPRAVEAYIQAQGLYRQA